MTSEQIASIVAGRRFPGEPAEVRLLETHISWIILTRAFVFKIKKPVRFSFLDFSTPERRAFFCWEELRLNRRLAPEMYLDVLPVGRAADGHWAIGPEIAGPLDFAVQMKRMDDRRQMDRLLRANAVSGDAMRSLAGILAPFHRSVVMTHPPTGHLLTQYLADFEDLFRLEAGCVHLFGPSASATLAGWRKQIGRFLKQHTPRLQARAASGYRVDGHGDLHSRNIFLLPEHPVVFDCIEFNPHFRQIDVLSDLAFLCMDLEAGGHPELEKIFMEAYLTAWPCLEHAEDERLFHYFKAYRANVRLKVALMETQQHGSAALRETAGTYWHLLNNYLLRL